MRSFLQKIIVPLLALCLLGGLWLAWHVFQESASEEQPEAIEKSRTIVELPEGKRAVAGIELGQVESREEAATATIPGRVTYDETRHVNVRVATSGVVTKLRVNPGESVEEGQLLATMSSPEVGMARADCLQRASELELARRKLAWEDARRASLDKIVLAIEKRVAPAEIRKASADQQLGSIREQLLSAYSDFLLAESLLARAENAVSKGALAGKTTQERQSQFESASSSVQAIIEQSRHDTLLASQAAKAATEDAQRRYTIAAQQVNTLLGANSIASPEPPLEYQPSDNLSLVEIRSPLRATVEQRAVSETERAEAGDTIFVLADTAKLWIKAQVRESQWSAVDVKPGDSIGVALPAFPNEKFEATVNYLGREVDPATNAIPLVLSIENASGRLRPGLFARVLLPLGKPISRLMIPESAVARHEGATFVFRPLGDREFERVDILGELPHDGWIEVKEGLKPGEKVVVRGTFVLKSELLLESEE